MFFDFSMRNVSVIITIFAVMLFSSLAFVILNKRVEGVPQAWQFIERQKFALAYWWAFKLRPQPARQAVASAADPAGAAARAVPALLYHGEGTDASMPLAVFVDQMRALHAAGWRTITLQQFDAFMKHGAQLPDRSFLITFDDGRRDSFYAADPVLRDLGFTAIMFVVTGFSMPERTKSFSKFYLSRSELAYMAESGRWELQSHGKEDHFLYPIPRQGATTAPVLTGVQNDEHFLSNLFWVPAEERIETPEEYEKRIVDDLTISRRTLEDDFGKPVYAYAYPYNDYGQNTVNLPQARAIIARIVPAIYSYAFYQVDPARGDTSNYPGADTFMIKRIEPGNGWTGEMLLATLEGSKPKALPYRVEAHGFGGEWTGAWGAIDHEGGLLTVAATDQTSGAAAFLDGSQDWRDYAFTARVRWHDAESTVSLLLRSDIFDDTSVDCSFSPTMILLEQHSRGSNRTIASVPHAPLPKGTEAQLTASANGGEFTCDGFGAAVSGVVADPRYEAGGIGIATWNSTIGRARAVIMGVSATAL